jgi:uncharacterized protein
MLRTITLLAAIALTLVAIKLLVAWIEPRMAFYPWSGVQETPAAAGLEYVDVKIPTADGETLHAWWLEDPSARAQVIFFHGNGGNLSLWLEAIVGIRRHGCSVLAVDYRGYGASTGSPTEQGVYGDAEASIALFEQRLRRPGTPVIYWGRSIGTPVATYAATRRTPDALVLESPIADVRTVVKNNPVLWLFSFLVSYRFPAAEFIRTVDVPLLVIHGDADSLVPYASGRRVFEAAPTSRKTFATVPGADHNDLHAVNPPLYWAAIDRFIASLSPGRG